MILGSIAVEEALLILKILFLVLLYLFIWRLVRSATREVRLPQEGFVLGPAAVGLANDFLEGATKAEVKALEGLLNRILDNAEAHAAVKV